jgi:hypothetical protein
MSIEKTTKERDSRWNCIAGHHAGKEQVTGNGFK